MQQLQQIHKHPSTSPLSMLRVNFYKSNGNLRELCKEFLSAIKKQPNPISEQVVICVLFLLKEDSNNWILHAIASDTLSIGSKLCKEWAKILVKEDNATEKMNHLTTEGILLALSGAMPEEEPVTPDFIAWRYSMSMMFRLFLKSYQKTLYEWN